jgi:hypothetical protein
VVYFGFGVPWVGRGRNNKSVTIRKTSLNKIFHPPTMVYYFLRDIGNNVLMGRRRIKGETLRKGS